VEVERHRADNAEMRGPHIEVLPLRMSEGARAA
jgi:hypothetical protein